MKTEPALSDEQEQIRIEGLRILARIIACRALADSSLRAKSSGEGRPAALRNGRARSVGKRVQGGDTA